MKSYLPSQEKICKDDILITGGGTIGVPYIVPNDDPIYMKDADLLCIQHSKEFDSRYLYHYFLSTLFRDYLKGITHDATIHITLFHKYVKRQCHCRHLMFRNALSMFSTTSMPSALT